MEEFCGSKFWDNSLSWYTNDPDLSPCFQKTVLVWIPCGFLLAFCVWDITKSAKAPKRPLPWTVFNITKIVITVLLMLTEIVRLSNSLRLEILGFVVHPVDKYTPIIKLLTYAISLGLLSFAVRKGRTSSAIQFTFWLVLLVCEIFPFRTSFREAMFADEENDNVLLLVAHVIYFPLIVGQFLLHCWADANPISTTSLKGKQPCSQHESSPLNQLLFCWFDPMAYKGYKKPLEMQDMWELNPELRSRYLVPIFDKYWSAKMRKNAYLGRKNNVGILSVIMQAFGWTYLSSYIIRLIPDLLALVSPQILDLLITFISDPSQEDWKGYLYAVLLFLTSFFGTLGNVHYFHIAYEVGMRVKTVLVSAVYRKALLISNASKKESTTGEIVNLMSVDVQKVIDVIQYLYIIWISPIQIALSIYFLWGLLGPSVLAGVGVIILLIPINGVLGAYVRQFQISQMANKDKRVKLVNEVLNGVKILKLYAWEPPFESEILKIRREEVKDLKKAAYLNAVNDFFWSCTQFMVAIATFATYVLVDETNVLDARKIFVSLSLLNVMTVPLTAMPMVFIWAIQAIVSLGRLNKFMNAEEIDPKAVTHNSSEADPVVIEHGEFSWDSENISDNVLSNINLRVKDGSLVAVVGQIGSGKSSLLSAILGELEKLSGRVNTKGSIGYVAQTPWIQNATLRDNVTFGKPYDPTKYDKVMEACALAPDLDILPGRDLTEIGEKGVNLSGGQKQRVSIARSVYNNADIYLLDDPLSAVDSHVGKHIFDSVLGPKGLLRRKTRILVTHGLNYLPQVDQIIVMKYGTITEVGTYQELVDKRGEFAAFLDQYANKTEEDPHEEEEEENIKAYQSQLSQASRGSSLSLDKSADSENVRQRRRPDNFRGKSKTKENAEKEALIDKSKIMTEETSETGKVAWNVYLDYFRGASWSRVIISVILYFVYQGFAIGSSLWLSTWSNEPIVNGTQANRDFYLGVYAGLGLLQSATFVLGAILLSLGCLRSSSVFHKSMLGRILRAPMSFFDTTPSGRIVNRFSRDVDVLDNTMPMLIRIWLQMFVQVLGTLILITYSTPIFAAVALPIAIVYYLVQKFYVGTSRQLKRLESVTRSPIYSHFGETVSGAQTIRAYKQQERFILQSEEKTDENQECYFPSVVSNRWLAIRNESLGAVIIFFAAVFAVTSRNSMTPGLVGLSITYSLQITFGLSYLVRAICDVEANIVAVERLKEYSLAPQEAPWKSSVRKPPKTWPAYGSIQFQNYETRYREGLDLVLRDFTCQIEPGEKIGVVGRTGAGKSSLTLALFRIIEASSGFITVDGENISKLGLHDVRGKFTIIPQDPILFSGTLRFNLDPFSKYSDSAVWRALELSHLKNFVKGLPSELLHPISEGGDNLSVGERQLVCLARALLRKTKILVLDEATAACDLETDDLIQATIRKEFDDCTIITVAHRLNTIMDSTRIMVVDRGQLAEFDTPEALSKNKESLFYSMAKDAKVLP